jgi:hypothetical protein
VGAGAAFALRCISGIFTLRQGETLIRFPIRRQVWQIHCIHMRRYILLIPRTMLSLDDGHERTTMKKARRRLHEKRGKNFGK